MWVDKTSESDNINDSNKNQIKRDEKVLKKKNYNTLKAIMGKFEIRTLN